MKKKIRAENSPAGPADPSKALNSFHCWVKPVAAALLLLAVLALVAWWAVVLADREMRAELLHQTQDVAQMVNVAQVQTLTGTDADLASPVYQQLKDDLISIGSANSNCKWIYLMGRRSDGSIFFLADSESRNVADATPPGEVYADVPTEYRRVFDTRTAAVEGPVADRWGVWVSGLIPMTDPRTGAVVAVLGMDLDASAWKWNVVNRVALPVGFLLVLLIGAATVVVSTRCNHASRNLWGVGSLLAAGLLVTAIVAQQQKSEADMEAKREFNSICKEVQITIETRLDAHEQILRSGAGLFSDDNGVTREEWREFSDRQKVSQKLPGIQGIGFAALVPGPQLAQHTREIRAEGFPDYRVWPAGEREAYSSIIYLEPFSGRNLRAFGYDMLTEPIRRAAMERARDRDEAVLSGKVTLVQETEQDVQAGTLMYVPVYRLGSPHETVAERRAALMGWVYSPYRMTDLMTGILGRWDLFDHWRIHLKIFDGETPSPEALLYDSQPVEAASPSLDNEPKRPDPTSADFHRNDPALLTKQIPVDAAGRRWLLSFSQAGGAGGDYSNAWLVLGSGTLISLLLSGLLLSLINTRLNARRLAERLTANLRLSEERYALTLNAVNDGLWDWNVPTGKAFFSSHYYSMLGYQSEEFPASYATWRSLVHPDDLGRVEEELQRSIEDCKGFGIDLRMKLKSGKWQWVETRGNVVERDAQGKVVRMVGTLTNITERKIREEELKSLRTAVEQSGNTVVITAPSGNIEYVNPAFEKTTGYTRAEAVGQNPRVLKSGVQDAAFYRALWETISSGKIWRGEFRNRRKDGSLYWESATISPIHNEQNEVVHFIAVKEDITERKAMEVSLSEALITAEAGNRAKSEFLGVMSHELRTPLNGVLGFAQLLSSSVLDSEQKDYAETIYKSGEHILAIVNDILDFSSIDAGTLAIHVAPLAVADLVKAAEDPVRKTAAEKGIELRCELAAGVPAQIIGDEHRMRQILINLLGNAVKFTSTGSVVLRVARSGQGAARPCDPQSLGSQTVEAASCRVPESLKRQDAASTNSFDQPHSAGGSFLDFSVEDTGIGISSEELGSLFQPFVQADLKSTRRFGGTGLGLAISRRIAEAMGGTITVASTPGKGSTFTFRFPLESAPVHTGGMAPSPISDREKSALTEHRPPVQTGKVPMPPEGGIVLVVEDDRGSRMVAGKMLEALGLLPEFAADGEGALQAFVPEKYFAILMDMSMPVMDGLEATKKIREIEAAAGCHVPIIALTANVLPGDRERCLAAGMDDFLAKPFKKADLVAKLARVAKGS
ncbi:MAG: CHASE domain-containing protein [Verrucomicrobiae bacterium]